MRARAGSDSWGGRAVLWMAWSLVIGAVASRLFDGVTRVIRPNGSVEFLAHGNTGGVLSALAFGLALIYATAALVLRRPRIVVDTPFAALSLLMVGWWVLCASVLRPDYVDLERLPFTLGGALIVAALVVDPPTMRTLHSVNVIRDVTAAVMLVFSVVDPVSSQLECRPDKCGIFGSLFTGVFPTENAAAWTIVLLVPAAITIRSSVRLTFSLAFSAVFLAATGSRTSLVDFVIVVAFVLLYRRYVLSGRKVVVNVLWRVIPVLMCVASLGVFLIYSGSELTDRGYLYGAMREELHGYALLLGSGPSTMERLYQFGQLRFEAVGEHGQAPHVLVQAGIVGLLLLLGALSALVVDRRPWAPGQVAALGLLLGTAVQFVTEPGWVLDVRYLSFALMLLAVGLFRRDPGTGSEVASAATAGGRAATSRRDTGAGVRSGPHGEDRPPGRRAPPAGAWGRPRAGRPRSLGGLSRRRARPGAGLLAMPDPVTRTGNRWMRTAGINGEVGSPSRTVRREPWADTVRTPTGGGRAPFAFDVTGAGPVSGRDPDWVGGSVNRDNGRVPRHWTPEPAFTVLLVCTGNICRSALAERLGRAYLDEALGHDATLVHLASAGVQAVVRAPMHPDSALVLRGLGGDPGQFRARQLVDDMVVDADLTLTMTRHHRRLVLRSAPRALKRTFTLREAAELVEMVGTDVSLPAAGLTERSRWLVRELAAARSRRQNGHADDIADPIGQPMEVHEEVGEAIAAALLPVLGRIVSLRPQAARAGRR